MNFPYSLRWHSYFAKGNSNNKQEQDKTITGRDSARTSHDENRTGQKIRTGQENVCMHIVCKTEQKQDNNKTGQEQDRTEKNRTGKENVCMHICMYVIYRIAKKT